MDKIEAITMLINFFLNNPNKNKCTFKKLNHIKYKLEKQFPNIFIDTSKTSILYCINNYPHIFNFNVHKNTIIKKKATDKYFKSPYLEYFNNNTSKQILEKIK